MFRSIALAVLCASSAGSTAEDDSPAPTTERHAVDYAVSCVGADDPAFTAHVDCQFEVTYRTADGMKSDRSYAANQLWVGHFGAVSGDTAVMTVKRIAGAGGRLYTPKSTDVRNRLTYAG